MALQKQKSVLKETILAKVIGKEVRMQRKVQNSTMNQSL